MTDTKRPEWMPSESVLTSMEYHAEEALRLGSHRNTHDAMRAFAYRTGLRAQIAALAELFRVITGDPDGFDPDIAAEIESRVNKIKEELAK